MPPKPPGHVWMVDEEKERDLKDIGERLKRIGELLIGKGRFKLDNHDISPPDPCLFIMRYERMPRGELSLKLELKWEPTNPGARSSSGEDIEISE